MNNTGLIIHVMLVVNTQNIYHLLKLSNLNCKIVSSVLYVVLFCLIYGQEHFLVLPGYEMDVEDGITAIQKQLKTLPKPNYILLVYLW